MVVESIEGRRGGAEWKGHAVIDEYTNNLKLKACSACFLVQGNDSAAAARVQDCHAAGGLGLLWGCGCRAGAVGLRPGLGPGAGFELGGSTGQYRCPCAHSLAPSREKRGLGIIVSSLPWYCVHLRHESFLHDHRTSARCSRPSGTPSTADSETATRTRSATAR